MNQINKTPDKAHLGDETGFSIEELKQHRNYFEIVNADLIGCEKRTSGAEE